MKHLGLIFLSGGVGSRMHCSLPKQYIEIQNKPLIAYSLDVLCSLSAIKSVAIVCDKAFYPMYKNILKNYALNYSFASPGKQRQESMFNGFKALKKMGPVDYILTHDAARPFPPKQGIETMLKELAPYEAASLAIPLTFSLKRSSINQEVLNSVDRHSMWEIQTPQLLSVKIIEEASLTSVKVTDDVGFAEHLGYRVKLFQGSRLNFKVTFPEDIMVAEALIQHQDREHAQV